MGDSDHDEASRGSAGGDRWTRRLSLLANLGAIAGLLLVGLQLRQNQELMRAQTRHELAAGIVELLETPAANPQLASVLRRGKAGEPLTPDEQFQFEMRSNALLRYWEDVHYQYRHGLYDESEFSYQKEAWRGAVAKAKGFRAYWCRVHALYSPQFRAELDRLVPAPGCAKGAGDEAQPAAAATKETTMSLQKMHDFGARYAAAWSSGDPARVARFFAEHASLTINQGAPAAGRAAITTAAKGFMTAFPDMVVTMDSVVPSGNGYVFHWTLIGTNTGPGGSGKHVRISGYEEWTIGADGLIANSLGHFDEAEYQRQLEHGVD